MKRAILPVALLAVAALVIVMMLRVDEPVTDEPGKDGNPTTIKTGTVSRRSLLPKKLPHESPNGEAAAETVDGGSDAKNTPEEVVDPAYTGLGMQTANQADLERLGVSEKFKGGVLVTNIHPDAPAAEVKLRKGDVIVKVMREVVTTPEELKKQIGNRGHSVITFSRDGHLLQVVLQKPFRQE